MNGVLLNAAGGMMGGTAGWIIYFAVIIGVFYFILIRPQNKAAKEERAMLASMEIGDSVLTKSGFYGVIIDISDDTVIVEFGNNKNCRIPMQKAAIAQIEKPGQAQAPADKKDGKDAGKDSKDSKEKKDA